MRSIKTEGVVVERALDALCLARGERIQIMEVAGELGEASEELRHAARIADAGLGLERDVDVLQAHDLAGAAVGEDAHEVFEETDRAFELGPVFRPVLEAFDLFWVQGGVHHPAQPDAHEFAAPRDSIAREQDAHQDEEQLTHGWEYNPRQMPGRIWEAVSYDFKR